MTERVPLPTADDWERERRIALARDRMRFGSTTYLRAAAIREIEALKAQRSPAMVAYLQLHPERG